MGNLEAFEKIEAKILRIKNILINITRQLKLLVHIMKKDGLENMTHTGHSDDKRGRGMQ